MRAQKMMMVSAELLRLPYARPFGIARWTRRSTDNVLVRVAGEGIEGLGEGAPNARYGEDAPSALAALAALPPLSPPQTLDDIMTLLAGCAEPLRGHQGALAALDGAMCDWLGKRRQASLASLLGLPARSGGLCTSYSIGLTEPQELANTLAAASPYPLLKIKLGADEEADDATLAALHGALPAACLRVDANEAWRDREVALRRILALEAHAQPVELCEQPLPAGRLDDVAWLRERCSLPLVADEDCVPGADLSALAAVYHGVNIKLDKEGGLLAACRRLVAARELGLSVMVGCMVASSLALTQAAHVALAGATWADLDGHLLLADDPFDGLVVAEDAQVTLPAGRWGLGVVSRLRRAPTRR